MAARDWNIPIRAIGNGSVNTTVPNIETWGFLINNPTLSSPVVPGALGFAQLVPWNQDTFTVNGSGQLDLDQVFYDWIGANYMGRSEAETQIEDLEEQIAANAPVQTDWNASSGMASILNKPLTWGWNDVSGKPTFFSGDYDDLTDKPSLFSGNYSDLAGKPVLFSGVYADLTGKPTLFSGNYADLVGIPSTFAPAAHTQAWSTITVTPTTLSGYGITDPVVLTSGTYSNPSWITGLAWSKITGAPTLFSGNYNDLTNKPTIPAAQVSSDWNAGSGVAQILNKPVLFSGSYTDLTNKPTIPTNTNQLTNGAGFITGVTSGQISTALGYTPYNGTTNPNGYLTSISGAQVNSALGYTPLSNITGLVTAGTNVTVTGSGTSGSPFVVSAGSAARVFNNSPSRTIQTVAAAANGWQIDATRDAEVGYSITIGTSLSLTGGTAGYVVLEVNATNATTGWVEIDRITSGQSGSGLVVGLAMNNSGGGSVRGIVQGGYYVRIRSINTSGTPTYSYNSGQEVKL